MSVPVWLAILSDQLTIVALVGRYPTNKLMVRGLILKRQLASRGHLLPHPPQRTWSYSVLAHLSVGYPQFEGRLPTRYSPVRHFTLPASRDFSFDLHVLGTPPAFILSQDQTLQLNWKVLKRDHETAHYLVFKDQITYKFFINNFFSFVKGVVFSPASENKIITFF